MKVKALEGTNKSEFTVILPIDLEVSDLSEEIQKAISKLGELKIIKKFELKDDNAFHIKTLERIKEQKADLWKFSIKFNEITD